MDLWSYEKELYAKGITYIGGVDEVGRGPLIGPVVTACCVLPKVCSLYYGTRYCLWNWYV